MKAELHIDAIPVAQTEVSDELAKVIREGVSPVILRLDPSEYALEDRYYVQATVINVVLTP